LIQFNKTLIQHISPAACIRIGDAKKVTQVEMLPEEQLLIVLSSKILYFADRPLSHLLQI
jgi:hypothetical protein